MLLSGSLMPPLSRILVIEDDPGTSIMLQTVLTRSGFEPVCVRDGEDGLARIREEAWSAVLLDLFLPRRSGLDILETLRSNGDQSATRKIIVLSAAGGPSVAAAEAFAPFGVIRKPFDIEELIRLVHDCVGDH